MRKVITFLGVTPRQTAYLYNGKTYEGKVFAEALRQFLDFDEMLVFVTKKARETAYPVLEALQDSRIRPVTIPMGKDEDELWTLFDCLTQQVAEGDTVIFDITHGLRSTSFLVFLAAAYLKEARDVTIESIYYGAFEARDVDANRTPVFDLTPFIALLDWLTATNQFVYTGDARYLAHLLEAEGQTRGSRALKDAGEDLRDLSLSMMLCRPLEVMGRAGKLEKTLLSAQDQLAQWAPPFGLLADRIQREYAARALRSPSDAENVVESLHQQYALIRWYLDNNQVIQAMSLAREWVVTAVGWRLGRGFELSLKKRGKLEWGLGGIIRLGREKSLEEGGGIVTEADLNAEGRQIVALPEYETLRHLWEILPGVRNDLDHVGMKSSSMKAAKLVYKAQGVIWPDLEKLACFWGLAHIPDSSDLSLEDPTCSS